MIAPIDKIKGLLSSDIINLFGSDILNSCFEEAWKFVNRIMLDNYVYEALTSSDITSDRYQVSNATGGVLSLGWSDNHFLRNRRILYVNRRVDGTSNYIEATKLESNLSTTRAKLASSIYYENDVYNPKYFSGITGGLEILPLDDGSNPEAKVYYCTFPRFGLINRHGNTHNLANLNFDDVTKIAEHSLFYGIPLEAQELIYIQMALNLIQYYMSDIVHEEEDTELSALLANQVASLDRERKEHIQFVVASFGKDNYGETK